MNFEFWHVTGCIYFRYQNIMVIPIEKKFWHAGVIFVSICNKSYYNDVYIIQGDLVFLVRPHQYSAIKNKK